MARFDYNSILCYVRGLWLRVAKFSISKPQRTGQGGERKKDLRQSEPIGDGKSKRQIVISFTDKDFQHSTIELVNKTIDYITIFDEKNGVFYNMGSYSNQV